MFYEDMGFETILELKTWYTEKMALDGCSRCQSKDIVILDMHPAIYYVHCWSCGVVIKDDYQIGNGEPVDVDYDDLVKIASKR